MTLLIPAVTSGSPNLDTISHCEALLLLRMLPDACVDLLVTDPPYFGYKKDEVWDNQWLTVTDYLAWLAKHLREMRRVLKHNGSLYLFASPVLAARVEVLVSEYFNVLNHIVWRKTTGNLNWTTDKSIQRSYLRNTERIIFAEQQKSMLFMRKARWTAGISSNEAARLFPSENGKLTGCVRNWEKGVTLPPEDKYNRLRTLYALPPYEEAVRPFEMPTDTAFSDVWDFPPVKGYAGKHPCEKPITMLRHIVRTSSRPGALVLDCFAGSGSTLQAARLEDRQYIGCDADIHWVSYARHRLDFLLQKPLEGLGA